MIWIRYWHNGKALENGNLRIKSGDSSSGKSQLRQQTEGVSSIFSILVKQAWKNYPCSPKDHLSMVVGKLFMQMWSCFHSSWFCLWRRCRWWFLCPLMREQTAVSVPWLLLVGSSIKPTSNLRLLCKVFEDQLPADAFWSETMKEHFLRHFFFGGLWRKLLNMDGFPTKLLSLLFFFLLTLNW